jgi:hypothetical protein
MVMDTIARSEALEKLRECRSGVTHADEVYRLLNRDEYIQELRPLIGPDDASWLLGFLSSPSPVRRKFALDLTKPLVDDERIKLKLKEMWRTEEDGSVRQSLLFAFLNVEDLAPEQHAEAFEWIAAHQVDFNESVLRWYGGEEVILDKIKGRAQDPSFSRRKHWIYLCCALASGKKADARQFIISLPGDDGELIERVRTYALSQLGAEPGAN